MPMGVLTLDWRLRKMEYIYMILTRKTAKFMSVVPPILVTVKEGTSPSFGEAFMEILNYNLPTTNMEKNAFVFDVIDCVQDGESEQAEALWFERYDKDQRFMYNCHFKTYGGPKCFGP
jgi:hypothetical protein